MCAHNAWAATCHTLSFKEQAIADCATMQSDIKAVVSSMMAKTGPRWRVADCHVACSLNQVPYLVGEPAHQCVCVRPSLLYQVADFPYAIQCIHGFCGVKVV